jgi:hypothetical protein
MMLFRCAESPRGWKSPDWWVAQPGTQGKHPLDDIPASVVAILFLMARSGRRNHYASIE